MLLQGRFAVITRAASTRGIVGRTAQIFADHGARFAILDLDEAAAKQAAEGLRHDHIGITCNVAKQETSMNAARRALEAFGRVGVLVKNAGITHPAKIMDIKPSDYRAVNDVALHGCCA